MRNKMFHEYFLRTALQNKKKQNETKNFFITKMFCFSLRKFTRKWERRGGAEISDDNTIVGSGGAQR